MSDSQLSSYHLVFVSIVMLIKPKEIKYINMHWQIIFSTFNFSNILKNIVRICRREKHGNFAR